MEIIKIAVCDDEKIFARKMEEIIAAYCKRRQIPYQIDMYQSGKSFLLNDMKMMEYQIVFLDINMEGLDGLETAKRLRKICRDTFVIFVTAFINYTLEGYKVEAIRYLLKTNDHFEQSVHESLDAVFQKMEYTPVVKNFHFQEGAKNIALERILYVESVLHKLTFYVWDEAAIVSYTMYETLNNISKVFTEDFVRIHQSYLVNLRFIRKLDGNNILLSNGQCLPVARSKRKEVCHRIAIYKGEI